MKAAFNFTSFMYYMEERGGRVRGRECGGGRERERKRKRERECEGERGEGERERK